MNKKRKILVGFGLLCILLMLGINWVNSYHTYSKGDFPSSWEIEVGNYMNNTEQKIITNNGTYFIKAGEEIIVPVELEWEEINYTVNGEIEELELKRLPNGPKPYLVGFVAWNQNGYFIFGPY
jgi:hypothetical protein